MALAFPDIRVGKPLRHEALTVFPLFTDSATSVDYRLSSEAIADKSVVVQEVDESGSVPDLIVDNRGDTRVLFIEGEELRGAKQNRILNATVLVAANSKVKVPVSCVERGRWAYKSKHFESAGSHSPSKLRHAMRKSVTQSTKLGRGHRSDQGEVWDHVDSMLCSLKVDSGSAAMSDAFDELEEKRSDYRHHLKYVDGASGVAVALGKKMVAVDLFDKPDTCGKVWDRILSGCVLEALRTKAEGGYADVDDVNALIAAAGEATWDEVKSVGEGEEFRTEFQDDHGSALTFEGSLLHGSVLAAE